MQAAQGASEHQSTLQAPLHPALVVANRDCHPWLGRLRSPVHAALVASTAAVCSSSIGVRLPRSPPPTMLHPLLTAHHSASASLLALHMLQPLLFQEAAKLVLNHHTPLHHHATSVDRTWACPPGDIFAVTVLICPGYTPRAQSPTCRSLAKGPDTSRGPCCAGTRNPGAASPPPSPNSDQPVANGTGSLRDAAVHTSLQTPRNVHGC